MLGQNGLDDGLLGDGFAGLGRLVAVFLFGLEVIDVEAQDVAVLDGVGDGVGVQLLLEQVRRGAHGGLGVLDLLQAGIGLEDGRAGEAEELRPGEERFDGLVVVAKLRAVAFVEDEDDALVCQGFELFLVAGLAVFAALAVSIQCQAQLLDGGDDHLVGVVF